MRRGRKHLVHENHERWMVSYADFITLLFAFFVVMFAASQADKGKAKQVSAALKQAFEEGYFASAKAAILGGTVDDQGRGSAQMKGPGGTKIVVPPSASKDKMVELLPSLKRLNEASSITPSTSPSKMTGSTAMLRGRASPRPELIRI